MAKKSKSKTRRKTSTTSRRRTSTAAFDTDYYDDHDPQVSMVGWGLFTLFLLLSAAVVFVGMTLDPSSINTDKDQDSSNVPDNDSSGASLPTRLVNWLTSSILNVIVVVIILVFVAFVLFSIYDWFKGFSLRSKLHQFLDDIINGLSEEEKKALLSKGEAESTLPNTSKIINARLDNNWHAMARGERSKVFYQYAKILGYYNAQLRFYNYKLANVKTELENTRLNGSDTLYLTREERRLQDARGKVIYSIREAVKKLFGATTEDLVMVDETGQRLEPGIVEELQKKWETVKNQWNKFTSFVTRKRPDSIDPNDL